jgi:hypothetical protein
MRANRIISTVALNPFLIDAQQILGKLLLSRKLQGLARRCGVMKMIQFEWLEVMAQ